MVGFVKWTLKKMSEYRDLKPEEYYVSPNGSTVYVKDKEGARKKAQELAQRLKKRFQRKN